jgi:hypothetical protein
LVRGGDDNILSRSVCTIKKTEALVVASKENGLAVNADKTKYLMINRDQNAVQSHNMDIVNSSFERVEQFKFLGTALVNQNSIKEETKIRLKSGNACCCLVCNLLSSSLLSKNIKIEIYKTIILPVLYGCDTWSLTLREECMLRVSENRVLKRIFGPKRER